MLQGRVLEFSFGGISLTLSRCEWRISPLPARDPIFRHKGTTQFLLASGPGTRENYRVAAAISRHCNYHQFHPSSIIHHPTHGIPAMRAPSASSNSWDLLLLVRIQIPLPLPLPPLARLILQHDLYSSILKIWPLFVFFDRAHFKHIESPAVKSHRVWGRTAKQPQ